ncbi:hypothetical protein DSECCO2_566920 [anaerobic digester metagenome]
MSRVHDHPRGFIDHRQILILIHHVQRDVLGLHLDGWFFGQGDDDLIGILQ